MDQLSHLLKKIDALILALESLKPLPENNQKQLDKKLRLEFNYNSNHIEGNTLTYGETELLLIFDDTKGEHTYREYSEMKAHDVAFRLVQDWAANPEKPLTEWDIKNLNGTILVQPFYKDAITPNGQKIRRLIKVGDYKEYPNSVLLPNGEIFDYASPAETPMLMGDLMAWWRTESANPETHPVVLAALFHYRFVRIHPFDDGNGRISRLLMNYSLLKSGLPPVIIKSTDKRGYLSALNQADAGDLDAFVYYVAKQVIWSLELSIKAAKGESIEESDDLDKEIALLKKELKTKTVLYQRATAENISQIIEYSVIPLCTLLEEKCADLKELFFDFDKHFTYRIRGGTVLFTAGSKESNWETVKQNWLDNNIRQNQTNIDVIEYSYSLRGLRNSINGDSFDVSIKIEFNDFNYCVRPNAGKESHVFSYDNQMSQEELKEIVNPLIRSFIERIKNSSSH